jgi:hypothetical protein
VAEYVSREECGGRLRQWRVWVRERERYLSLHAFCPVSTAELAFPAQYNPRAGREATAESHQRARASQVSCFGETAPCLEGGKEA